MAVYTTAELAEVTALGTSEAQIFSNSNKCIIKQILLCNYTSTDRTVEIKVIPSGAVSYTHLTLPTICSV